MRLLSPLVAPALAFLAGCMHTSAFLLGETRFAPHPRDHEILVFDTIEDVPFPYVKVARVVASGSSQSRWDSVLAGLKDKAREVGADAIVLGRAGDDAADLDSAGGVVMRRTLWALAIRRQQPPRTTPQ
ncbi:MAG TPA: hypothetical protein VK081_14220 [Planctomycetota bacterium]|nr:hypothetical protein [Planctomycetota bacterium]